jgi:hypothetical protein
MQGSSKLFWALMTKSPFSLTCDGTNSSNFRFQRFKAFKLPTSSHIIIYGLQYPIYISWFLWSLPFYTHPQRLFP